MNRGIPGFRLWLTLTLIVAVVVSARHLNAQTLALYNAVASQISSVAGGPQSLFPDGTAAAPSISFASDPDTGLFLSSSNTLGFAANGNQQMQLANTTLLFGLTQGNQRFRLANSAILDLSSTTGQGTAGIMWGGASITEVNNGTAGSKAGIALARLIASQTVAPLCIDNCGSAGAAVVTGSDSFMRIVLGTSIAAQGSFAVAFQAGPYLGTNPACVAMLNNAGTASVSSTNSTATGVTVNLVARPANSQQYAIYCPGLSG